MSLRWEDGVGGRDVGGHATAEDLWKAAASIDRGTCYVLGVGFDPRALVGLTRLQALRIDRLRIVVISLQPMPSVEVLRDLAAQNQERLRDVTAGLDVVTVDYPAVGEPRVAGLRIARDLLSAGHIDGFDHLVVDISSLPSSISFPLAGSIIKYHDEGRGAREVQLVVAENPELDEQIREQGVDDAGPVHGFKQDSELRMSETRTRIWAPVLGKGHEPALRKIHQQLEPHEVCPVLPFPATDPRRADNLLLEYRRLLFEEIPVERRNVIYAAERNPFDLYRALSRLRRRYFEALEPIGPTSLTVSTHTSKALSIGALLAAYEHGLPIYAALPTDYTVDPGLNLNAVAAGTDLSCLWICGEPYR